MIRFEEAYDLVLEHAGSMPAEKISLAASIDRILAENIHSDMDMPPFDKSAMDGFACRKADISAPLKVIETIPAGKVPEKNIEPGTCARIMTGAPVPEGADCVIIVEKTKSIDEATIEYLDDNTATNICLKGEDIKAGDRVLEKGKLIRPQEIAVLASVGCHEVTVFQRPRAGIISTGSELYEPGVELPKGGIRDSNSYQLAAQVEKAGITPVHSGIVKDTPADIQEAIQKLEKETDILLISGGVSAGDYDYVPGEVKNAGYKVIFHKVMIRPGMPLLFAVKNNKYCFGLPGNPVSTFVQFEFLIKPFLHTLMGGSFNPQQVSLPTAVDFKHKKTDRDSIIPVRVKEGKIHPLEYHGSAHINALTSANGFIRIRKGIEELKQGEYTDVRLI